MERLFRAVSHLLYPARYSLIRKPQQSGKLLFSPSQSARSVRADASFLAACSRFARGLHVISLEADGRERTGRNVLVNDGNVLVKKRSIVKIIYKEKR